MVAADGSTNGLLRLPFSLQKATFMPACRALLLAALLTAPQRAGAQSILGVILEDGSRHPVSGAEVLLVRSGSPERPRAVTDTAGRFRIPAPGPGQYRLSVRHVAFAAFDSDPLDLAQGETITLEIRVATNRIALQPLVVTVRTTNTRLAAFHERRLAHSFGRFLTREEIDRRGGSRTTDLLRSFPGIALVPATTVRGRPRPGGRNLIAMRGTTGTCEPAIYLDGLRITQSSESTIDDVLVPSSLEGVEIYTSLGGAPAQYVEQGKCGVILFWTRSGEATGGKWSWQRLLLGAGAIAAVLLLVR